MKMSMKMRKIRLFPLVFKILWIPVQGKYTGILCDAKQKNYKIKYLGRHKYGAESRSDE